MNPSPLLRFFPDIRCGVEAVARSSGWPDFEVQIATHLIRPTLPPHAVLPLASAAAVGGDPRRALAVSVAICYLIVAMRWFDDLQDRDRGESLWNEIGPGRAVNMAAAALTVAWRVLADEADLPPVTLRAFGRHTVTLARGQDCDLRGAVAWTMDDHWGLMRSKTGAALALGCELGALAACPHDPAGAVACRNFGEHMGVLLQILDDLDGTFHPDGVGDLRAGKATLPVLYGLALDHGAREELQRIVQSGQLSACPTRVREILDGIDTREFLVCCAFEEHRKAVDCIDQYAARRTDRPPSAFDGLLAFADSLMLGWESLLQRTAA